jgi:hypothetical protein
MAMAVIEQVDVNSESYRNVSFSKWRATGGILRSNISQKLRQVGRSFFGGLCACKLWIIQKRKSFNKPLCD